jgi:hypothetical protein
LKAIKLTWPSGYTDGGRHQQSKRFDDTNRRPARLRSGQTVHARKRHIVHR